MADLNKELNEYLLSNKNEKQFKIPIPSVTLPKPTLGKWFGGNGEQNKEEAGWFKETQKDCCPSMTRLQRLTAFALCFFMGILCFCLSAIYIPVLLLKARKFALLYSLGSLFFLMSFCFLWGPMNYLKSLFTVELYTLDSALCCSTTHCHAVVLGKSYSWRYNKPYVFYKNV
ncbi:vesicle transport protein SFT2C isoform X2 [Cephus cinctus]|uniref:Vesicle transport protein n=1 Tax=Cephus cinctus TaxID=211228 RepID=A0AAJ7CES7_CEPCN|nr:vesicle transport protein SFT2C isoform X2 [Cephus cinctus]